MGSAPAFIASAIMNAGGKTPLITKNQVVEQRLSENLDPVSL
jgi:hypothetical protein